MTGQTGQVIFSIIIVILLILANVKDFVYLLKGYTNEYIQYKSGMLYTLLGLLYFVPKLNNLEKKLNIIQIVLLYGAYITIYTLIFFKIKKYKEDRRKDEE